MLLTIARRTQARHKGRVAPRGASFVERRALRIPLVDSSPLETLEKLEQMRALEAGMQIVVGRVERHARGVDTQEDLDSLRAG